MLDCFAITPEAFAVGKASSPNAFAAGIGCLNDLCNNEGLFLDLRDGRWGDAVEAVGREAREFRRFARKRRRLITVPPALPEDPGDEEGWLWEAQRRHERDPCRAVVTSEALGTSYADVPAVVSMERLNSTPWWAERSPSVALPRRIEAYLEALAPILRHANFLMFIDPHIDPTRPNYREFPRLLCAAGTVSDRPLIQIHRASHRKGPGGREVQRQARWIHDFNPWHDELSRRHRKAEVFLWEDLHDRFLVSDMVAISIPYGFDTSEESQVCTSWSRLGRADQERLEREYDANGGLHGLVGRFEIGSD